MTIINGLRLLLAARKSRKNTGDDTDYERQDHRAKTWAETQGHAVVHATKDVKSSQSAPWKRRELGPWMTQPAKLAMYDAILISDTDRISRGTDQDLLYIEDWCYRNEKSIIVANGPWFPPREGPMGDSDRYQWIAQKRAARTYWEAVRDKHADIREVIKANGAAIGRPPFGYQVEGTKLHKTFTIDPVTGPLAREAFQRIADGRTATSVAEWLTDMSPIIRDGKRYPWRVKRVIDMIKRTSYLGSRDGHEYDPLITRELWEAANTAILARYVSHGGRRIVNGYSGVVYCECGASLYHHQSTRDGKPAGIPKYMCSRGRRGIAGEQKCGRKLVPFDQANQAVNRLLSDDWTSEYVMVTTGGDAGRQAELSRIQNEMTTAMACKDMQQVTVLAAEYAVLDAQPAEPIRTIPRKTGRKISEVWNAATITDQRRMLANHTVTVLAEADGTFRARYDDDDTQGEAA